MAWFLNPALTRFRNEVNSRWPRRDKTSDGTIGDAAHASRTSDHNPDPDGSVDAWDMDVDGVDVAACKRAFEAHEASAYWIHNDQISFRDEGWRPRSYAYAGPGRNRHDKHVHWNSRQSREDSNKPWFTDTQEENVAFTEAQEAELLRLVRATNSRVESLHRDKDSIVTTWAADNDAVEPNAAKAARLALAVGETARDAAQNTLIQQVLAAAGNPLTSEQFAQLVQTVREAGEQAGAAASEALQERLAAAAQAEADALTDAP